MSCDDKESAFIPNGSMGVISQVFGTKTLQIRWSNEDYQNSISPW